MLIPQCCVFLCAFSGSLLKLTTWEVTEMTCLHFIGPKTCQRKDAAKVQNLGFWPCCLQCCPWSQSLPEEESSPQRFRGLSWMICFLRQNMHVCGAAASMVSGQKLCQTNYTNTRGGICVHMGDVQNWEMVSTHLKNISQIGSFTQVGVKIKHM